MAILKYVPEVGYLNWIKTVDNVHDFLPRIDQVAFEVELY